MDMYLLIVAALLTVAVPSSLAAPEDLRVDCHPDPDVTESSCLSRGCLFDPPATEGPPDCYYPPEFGYRMYGQPQPTENGFLVELVKSGPASFAPDEFNFVLMEVEQQTDTRLRIKIHPNTPRFEVPLSISTSIPPPMNPVYSVELSSDDNDVFSFRVLRKSTGTVIFDTSLGGLTLADQFLQVGAKLPSTNVYGLGENEHRTMRHDMTWKTTPMFARGVSPNPDISLYGVHPHYTVVEDDGNVHSVLFLNSNNQEVVLTPAPGIVYRTIGGILDLYFFLGPTPENSVEQYTEAVGRHPLPAYWSLGFHLCRWGYNNTENMVAAYNRTVQAGIPLDAQWGDIDVFERRLDFTYDRVNFAALPGFIQELHDNDRRFVIIVDPGVATGEPDGSYPAFEDGTQNGVWVLDANGQPLQGRVWPTHPVHFADFSNPATHDWWTRSLQTWRRDIDYDGIWIDMNEPSNFVTGSVGDGCAVNKYNNPPYLPAFGDDNINSKTICMDAEHRGGLHYDTHSLYGWYQAEATANAVRSILGSERGIVLCRSTFVGTGKHAAHWLGDNWSRWNNMKTSIIGIVEMNQFGIPLVGADICGFTGNTDEELCARWQLLGAFYPFSRNHNEILTADQDPGMWPDTVAVNARNALRIRYSLLPYLYTLFYQHTANGGTVVRPLWHEFPYDSVALGVDEQFLWGPNFMISPAMQEGQTVVTAYFPEGANWYDYHTGIMVSDGVQGQYLDLDCPLSHIPLHVRGGAILVTQPPEMTTVASRLNNFELLAALDESSSARGDLYWDDGHTIDDALNRGSMIAYQISDNTLTSTVTESNFDFALKVAKVTVWGVEMVVTDVVVNEGATTGCEWSQESTDAILVVDCSGNGGGGLDALGDWTIKWQ